MAYTVRLTERAYADIDAIVTHIAADSPVNAARWQARLFDKVSRLDFSPLGCSLAPENEYAPFEVRQTLLGNYRILFTVLDDQNCVQVLTIRHAARRLLPPDEFTT